MELVIKDFSHYDNHKLHVTAYLDLDGYLRFQTGHLTVSCNVVQAQWGHECGIQCEE